MMTLEGGGGEKDDHVVVVEASAIPPGYEISTTLVTTETAKAFEENSANDYRSEIV